MKLAFSTLGCPSWDFDEILTVGKDLGYKAIEVRGVSREMHAPDIKAFNDKNINETREKLNRLDMEICMLTSGASLALYNKREDAVAEAKEYIDLAEKLGVKYVRVMGTDRPQIESGDINQCKRLYVELCGYGKSRGVTPLMETNGMFADTALLAEFLADTDNGGALWDVNHPYRFAGESVVTTIKNLGKRIKHVHMKDSVADGAGGAAYKMPGQGDIPLKEAVILLKGIGYDGYCSLEWVKRWNQNLEEPGIVFSQYVSFMNSL